MTDKITHKQDEKKGGFNPAVAATAAVIGAGIVAGAIALSDDKNRKKVTDALTDVKEKAEDMIDDVKDRAKDQKEEVEKDLDELKDRAEKVTDSAKSSLRQGATDAKKAAQI